MGGAGGWPTLVVKGRHRMEELMKACTSIFSIYGGNGHSQQMYFDIEWGLSGKGITEV